MAGASPSSADSAGGTFAVQVFAGDRSQAEKIASSLSRKGYSARVVPGNGGTKGARVRVYGYRSRTDAQKGAERLRKEGSLKPWVVKAD